MLNWTPSYASVFLPLQEPYPIDRRPTKLIYCLRGVGMEAATMTAIRSGSKRVSLYNEGLAVYLYDLGSSEYLRSLDAPEVVVDGDVQDRGKRLKQIEKEHLFIAYELQGDGCPEIEVSVGEPLTPKEKKPAKWCKLQRTVLSIPSGQLRLETPNSLSIGREEPLEQGVTLEVPPGDFVLTLHRIDFEQMPETEDGLPTEVITLTPLADTKPPTKTPAWLDWADVMGDLAKWEREWKVKDGVFYGLLQGKVINLTRTAREKLGLRWGDHARIQGEGWQWEAVYTGRTTPWWAEATFGKALVEEWKKCVQGAITPEMANSGNVLSGFQPFDDFEPGFDRSVNLPITLTVLETPLAPRLDLAAQRVFTRNGDVYQALVLACCSEAVTINLTWEDLRPSKLKPTDRLEIDFGGDVRTVYPQNPASEPAIGIARSALALRSEGFKEEVSAILAKDPDFYAKEPYKRDLDSRMRDQALDKKPLPRELGSELALKGRQLAHWEAYGVEVMWLQPILGNDVHVTIAPNSPITVRVVRG